jgi:hypothetical protein
MVNEKKELIKIRKKLEKLDTKQEKIIFLRDFILDKKNDTKLREDVMEILNSLLEDEGLEEIVAHKEDFSLKDGPVETVEQRVIEIPVGMPSRGVEEEEIGHVDYSVGGGPGKIYAESENITSKHLREFLKRKGVLGTSDISLPALREQISDYFGGSISDSRLESYSSLFSADEVGYQVLSSSEKEEDDSDTFKLEGKERKYYKVGDE